MAVARGIDISNGTKLLFAPTTRSHRVVWKRDWQVGRSSSEKRGPSSSGFFQSVTTRHNECPLTSYHRSKAAKPLSTLRFSQRRLNA